MTTHTSALHVQGTAIKTTGNNTVGGYLVVWGDSKTRDLQGEYFTPQTDFALDWFEQRPVLYHHGLDGEMKAAPIGRITSIKMDSTGIWAEAQLDMYKKHVESVQKLVKQGVLHWSSGSLSHLVEVAEDGEIKRWPLIEGSMTPTPAEPRNTDIKAIKSAYEELGIDTSKLRLSTATNTHKPEEVTTPKEADSGLKADANNSNNNKNPLEDDDMPLTDEMKAEIRQFMNETKAELEAEDVKMTDEEAEKMEEEVEGKAAKMEDEPETVKAALPGLIRDALTNVLNERLERANTVKSVVQDALTEQARNMPSKSQAGSGDDRPTNNTNSASKTFDGVPNIDSGFAKRVDRAPMLMHIKSQMPSRQWDDDVRKYKTHLYEANKASAISGANLDFLMSPAQREQLVEELLPKTFLDKVGATMTTVEGNQTVERPKLTKSPKGVWLGENDEVPEDTFTAQMLLATPKPVAGFYQLPLAGVDRLDATTEGMLKNQLLTRIALAINEAAHNGVGNVNTGTTQAGTGSTGAQPLGLLNALPSAQITNLSTAGRAPTPKDMSNMKSAVEARDIELGASTHWVYHSNVLNYFEDLTDTTGQLINRSQWTKGYEPVTTNVLPTNLGTSTDLTRILFGDWQYFEVVQSNMMNLRVFEDSVYTKKLQIGVMAWTFVDFLIHYTEAFEIRNNVKV